MPKIEKLAYLADQDMQANQTARFRTTPTTVAANSRNTGWPRWKPLWRSMSLSGERRLVFEDAEGEMDEFAHGGVDGAHFGFAGASNSRSSG
jgi:hypothetical protein